MVGMLAAENPSVDGHMSASTPRRRGKANAMSSKLTDGSINLPQYAIIKWTECCVAYTS